MTTPCIPFIAARQAQVNNPGGLNLRRVPGLPASILEVLVNGTILNVVPPDVASSASGLLWTQVVAPSGNVGYVASGYLGPVGPPPIPPAKDAIGIHAMQDGYDATAHFLSLLPSDYVLPSATVLNEPKIVTLLNPRVKYLLYRDTNHEDPPPIPDDTLAAMAVGQRWANDSMGWINLLPTNVRVICMNERKWSPGHGGFWLGYLKALDSHGRKGCIGAYAVGQPEPNQWLTMVDALRYAAANDHLVALHSYCQSQTIPGMLSADGANYEFRGKRLYDAVPSDARPLLICSEDGHEFTRGLYEGVHALIQYSDREQLLDRQFPQLISRNKWTVGGHGPLEWDTSSIDEGLPALANFISTGRYP